MTPWLLAVAVSGTTDSLPQLKTSPQARSLESSPEHSLVLGATLSPPKPYNRYMWKTAEPSNVDDLLARCCSLPVVPSYSVLLSSCLCVEPVWPRCVSRVMRRQRRPRWCDCLQGGRAADAGSDAGAVSTDAATQREGSRRRRREAGAAHWCVLAAVCHGGGT